MVAASPVLIRLVTLIMALIASAAEVAAAQTASRPYRGLFGPGDREEQRPPARTLLLSVYSGVDDNSRFESSGAADHQLQTGHLFQGAHASFTLARRRPRTTVVMNVMSSWRYYADVSDVATQYHQGGVSVGLRPSRRVSVDMAQNVAYSPSYQIATVAPPSLDTDTPLEMTSAAVDYAVARAEQMVYDSSARVQYLPTRNGAFAVAYSARYEDFFTQNDFTAVRAAARYVHRLSRDIAVRSGYGLGRITVSGAPAAHHHDLDLGVDYRRALVRSSRTVLAVTSGSAIVSTSLGRQFTLTGGVRLQRRLSPRWSGAVGYHRGLQVLRAVPRPFVTNTVDTSVRGYLNSRVMVTLTPSYAAGAEPAARSRSYASWATQARVDVALSRHWAVYAEQFYYSFRFRNALDLPAVLASGLNRRGLRWGLALWAPVGR